MSKIIQNVLCPACAENGHDSTGDHLMVFRDGGKYCNRSHFHRSGTPYYIAPTQEDPVFDVPVTGRIKYTPEQFRALESEGKLDNPRVRALAIDGMRGKDAYAVLTHDEKEKMHKEWFLDMKHFESLKIMNVPDRNLSGQYLKFYNVRVGVDRENKVIRHFYPRYTNDVLVGAKCRTVPKDFRFGHLGRMFGQFELFGQATLKAVLDSGQRMHTLLVTGGELDAIAAQQMLHESQIGTEYQNRFHHVWSVNDGEHALRDITQNKSTLNRFSKIVWCFDNDEAGKALTRECCLLFPEKSFVINLPTGCKDPNDCLMYGKEKEFIESWWNPSDPHEDSDIRSIEQIKDLLKEAEPSTGSSWPWPSMNRYTLGRRPHQFIVITGGTGCGKTQIVRLVAHHGISECGESFGVISTEDPFKKVSRGYIGPWIDKRIELPATPKMIEAKNEKGIIELIPNPNYNPLYDYTKEQADAAIDQVAELNKLFIANMHRDYSIDNVMTQVKNFVARGIRNIIVDNLSGITVSKTGVGNHVVAIDNAMRELGTFKDTHPITLYLLCHLSQVKNDRTPHERGGEVFLSDIRGSGAIGHWCSYALAVERNVSAENPADRCKSVLRLVKDRDQGIYTGSTVHLLGDMETGRIIECKGDDSFLQASVQRAVEHDKQVKNISKGEF